MESKKLISRYSILELAVLYAAWIGFFLYVTRLAWVSEDAYITFRVIDNLMNGYGLRWNTHERVQVYTHPLWMLLHIPMDLLWHNLFLGNIVLSIVCTVAAMLITFDCGKKSVPVTLVVLFLPLVLSKTFMDYTTSGLENPLSYLLFAWFGRILLKQYDHPYFWFYASLATSLALLNRLDMAVPYLPIWGYLIFSRFRPVNWQQVLGGMYPLILWMCFSLFYYGFLFPNTKYAKLDTGMALSLYLSQGLHYTMQLVIEDTLSILILLSSVYFIVRKSFVASPQPLPLLFRYIAMGVAANIAYVIYIGGDYMIGRFWSFPLFVSIWLWYVTYSRRLRSDVLVVLLCAMFCIYFIAEPLKNMNSNCGSCFFARNQLLDARFTFRKNALFTNIYPPAIRTQGEHYFAKKGQELAQEDPNSVKFRGKIGTVGFHAGPDFLIVDTLALTDPLLARLPAKKKQDFYIGHFARDVPKGYQHALETGSLKQMPEPLAKYYEKLRIITSGNLDDIERLKTIVLFNLGYYDHWKKEYLHVR